MPRPPKPAEPILIDHGTWTYRSLVLALLFDLSGLPWWLALIAVGLALLFDAVSVISYRKQMDDYGSQLGKWKSDDE